MSLIIAAKRHLLILAVVVAGLALSWSLYAAEQLCDLPMETPNSSANSNDAESPEDPKEGVAVLHQQKFILCLPEPAAEAHIRHGDTRLGPCDKHGRVK